MSYLRKYPRQFVGWRCRTCGCAGITGAKDIENLIRGIRRHHNEKSPGCEFSRENVAMHEPPPPRPKAEAPPKQPKVLKKKRKYIPIRPPLKKVDLPIPSRLDVTPEFGLWFSGFFDGEGSFAFSVAVNGHKRPAPKIQLTVRQDDAKTIEYIREQVRCGRAYFSCKYRSDKYKNHRPWATFRVSCIADLAEIIVPLFESYPLHTKKAKEFAAWKVVVQKRYRMKNKRYSEVELSRHTELCAEISELRNWSEMPIPVPLASSPGLLPA